MTPTEGAFHSIVPSSPTRHGARWEKQEPGCAGVPHPGPKPCICCGPAAFLAVFRVGSPLAARLLSERALIIRSLGKTMPAHTGERAGTFHYRGCDESVWVRKRQKIPRCPCGGTTFESRTHEAGTRRKRRFFSDRPQGVA